MQGWPRVRSDRSCAVVAAGVAERCLGGWMLRWHCWPAAGLLLWLSLAAMGPLVEDLVEALVEALTGLRA